MLLQKIQHASSINFSFQLLNRIERRNNYYILALYRQFSPVFKILDFDTSKNVPFFSHLTLNFAASFDKRISMTVFLSSTFCRKRITEEKKQCLLRTATFLVREREKVKRRAISHPHLACEPWLLSFQANGLPVYSAM